VEDPVLLVSMPKGGTHLAEKCLSLLTQKNVDMREVDLLNPHDPRYKNYFCSVHFFENSLPRSHDWKLILNIRDLRDVIVSFNNRSFAPEGYDQKLWDSLTEEEKISYFINDYEGVFNPLIQTYDFLALLESDPKSVVIRFENLVGPLGGGSLELQKREIEKIADYLNISVSEEDIAAIAGNIFGNTSTFKMGQIGAWKTKFTPQHKKDFKARFGSLLIKLGYAQDDDW
jgi:hypothetical protein